MDLNLKLNPGGAILAILGLFAAGAAILLAHGLDSPDPPEKGLFVVPVVVALGAGALGNLLWKKVFPPRQ